MASLKLTTICVLILLTMYSITVLQNWVTHSYEQSSTALIRSKRTESIDFFQKLGIFAKGGYQENCYRNPVDSCDPLQFLVCGLNFKCECPNPETQFYDNYDLYCKIKAGEVCYNVSGIGCTDHAECIHVSGLGGINETKCACDLGTTANKYGKCGLPYGHVCTGNRSELCDRDGHLECDPVIGTCHCERPRESWFDPDTEECLLMAGATCLPSSINATAQRCAQNSVCVVDITGRGTCSCISGAKEDSRGRCALPYGYKCSGINDYCDRLAHLECNLGTYRCDCASPNATWYDPQVNECRIRGGQPCFLNPGRQMCVDKAECLLQDWGESYCVCHVGLSPGVDGQCTRKYMNSCKINHHEPDRCDAAGHQRCRQGICMCENPLRMAYSEKERRCYMTHNSPCSESSAPCNYNLACVNGLCKCDTALGLADNGSGQCIKLYGTSCSRNNSDLSCDPSAYLDCQDGRCQCAAGYEVVSGMEEAPKCVGNLKSRCRSDRDCDHEAGLVCAIDGRCRCYLPDEHFWDGSERRCLGKLNSRCHFGWDVGKDSVRLGCGDFLNCQPVDQHHGTCQCSSKQKLVGKFCGTNSQGAALRFSLFTIYNCLTLTTLKIIKTLR